MRTPLHTSILVLALLGVFSVFEGCYSRVALPDTAALNVVNPQNGNIESASYIIREGDHLKITAINYQEFDTTAVVSETGSVTIKLIGDMHIGGLTKAAAEKAIAEGIAMYAKSLTVVVSISVFKGAEAKMVLLGSVAHADTFSVTTPVSLLQALAVAGGTSLDADMRRIKIYRHDPNIPPLEFDLASFIASGSIRDVPKIGPGDVVYVPRQEDFLKDLFGYLRDSLFLFGFFSIAK